MPEENQNVINQTSAPITNDIGSRLSGIRNFRQEVKLRKSQQTQNNLDNNSNALFEQSLNVTNKDLSQKYNMASQSAAAASMIKSYAERNGDDWSDLNTPTEILTEYFNLNPDDETFNKIMDFTKSDRDPEDFGIEMGWVQRDRTDKAKEGVVGPFARAIGAIAGFGKGLYEGVGEASQRPREFEQRQIDRGYVTPGQLEANDVTFGEDVKWMLKFLGTLGNMVGDVVGGGMMGAAKGFTTHEEQAAVENKVAQVFASLINGENGQKVMELYNGLDDQEKQELKDRASILDGLSDIPLSALGIGAAKQGVKQTIKAGGSEFVQKGVKSLDNAIETRNVKKLIKNKVSNIDERKKLANIIGQGETKDIDNSVRALESILGESDSSSIKTFQDLQKAGKEKVSNLSNQVDDYLSQQKGLIKASDQHIVTSNGQEMGRVVDDAIADLKDVYTKQRNPDKLNEVLEFEKRFNGDGVSYKELNDFSREYGIEMDSWNAKNQLTTDAKVGTEKTRKGMKDIISERMPDEQFKNLNEEMASVSNFNKLVDKTVERVNNVEKQMRDKGMLESVREAWSEFKSSIRGDLRGDTQNIYQVERSLPEKIEIFNQLSNDISKAETAEEALKLINKANDDIRVGLTTVKGYEDQPYDSLVNYANMLDRQGDIEGAKRVLDYTLEKSEKDIKETLGDSLISIDKTVGRYGSNEPTFYLRVNNDSPETISKIASIAKQYKQNSFFTAKKVSSDTPLGLVKGKPGTAIEPGVIIKTEKSIENMADLDKILKDAGLDGATLLPGGKGIEIYNLSNFGDADVTKAGIEKLLNNSDLAKYGIDSIDEGKFEIMHIGMKQSGRGGWAGNQQGLGGYNDLSKYLKSLSSTTK